MLFCFRAKRLTVGFKNSSLRKFQNLLWKLALLKILAIRLVKGTYNALKTINFDRSCCPVFEQKDLQWVLKTKIWENFKIYYALLKILAIRLAEGTYNALKTIYFVLPCCTVFEQKDLQWVLKSQIWENFKIYYKNSLC